MPFDRSKYPKWWKQFSAHIRFERAGNCCEKCGIENGTVNDRGSVVVLTVAHLDDAEGVCDCLDRHGLKCTRSDHVLALCQACHLKLDHPKHVANRLRTLAEKKDSERGLLAGSEK